MRLPREPLLHRRAPFAQTVSSTTPLLRIRDSPSILSKSNGALIVAVVFVGILVFGLFVYLLLRHFRRTHKEPPKSWPASLQRRWRAWAPGTYIATPNSPRLRNAREARRAARRAERSQRSQGVDRVSSIRSIMTLPAYRPTEDPERERTIGREGERAGIDVVIEYPENEEEEETRREEHMQTLYEIRLARQLERAAEREGEQAAAARPQSSSAASGGSGRPGSATGRNAPQSSAANLLAALAAVTERERRMSSVQYAEIGVARHDGSRVRPSSESDSRPLLESGAPMGATITNTSTLNSTLGRHSRAGSYSSERRGSDEIFNLGSARPSMTSVRATSPAPGGTVRSMLYPDNTPATAGAIPPYPPDTPPAWGDLTPAEYDGDEWGPPPDYTSPIETRNRGPETLPILTIDTATPAASTRAPTPSSHSTSAVGSRGGTPKPQEASREGSPRPQRESSPRLQREGEREALMAHQGQEGQGEGHAEGHAPKEDHRQEHGER